MQPSSEHSPKARLFGTDGIRGRAGEYPLDPVTVFRLGAALGKIYAKRLGRQPRFVVGRDTRESGEWIRSAFTEGTKTAGVQCDDAGVMTTPGIAFVTGHFEFDAGIVISASHNPFEDNGLKIFSPCGRKLDEGLELELEKAIVLEEDYCEGGATSRSENFEATARYHDAYIEHLNSKFEGISLAGTKIVIDCANGAASAFAPRLVECLGADLILINADPDGLNINRNCGSLHLENLQQTVVGSSADIGVAFDGDADRALFVDANGEIVDGDATLWIIANQLMAKGKLTNRRVVATVMSNIGLELALGGIGVGLYRVNVGDKYVLEGLLETGSEVGGEQSGHIIIPEIGLVGDGLVTMLSILQAMERSGKSLSSLASGFVRYPQVLLNISVAEKRPFEQVERIAREKAAVESELRGSGRLLLRYSGTENLARVMIEGKDQKAIEQQAERLGNIIKNELGSVAR